MENIKIIKDRLDLSTKDQLIARDGLPLNQIVTEKEMIAAKKQESFIKGVLYEVNDDGYGNEVLKRVNSNTVVFAGAVLALEHLADVTATFKPATLNEIFSLNSGIAGSNANSFIKLFGVGTGGAALDFGNVNTPSVKQREVANFIPLRTGASIVGTTDLTKYYFKKSDGSGGFNWYLKEFDTAPIIKTLWKDAAEQDADGTEITSEIYNSPRTEGIESFAEFRIKFNSYDVREYYESISEMEMARYNSIGLFTGQKVDIGGGVFDYVNVRLFSVVNFENSSVKEKKESTYVYRVYSLV